MDWRIFKDVMERCSRQQLGFGLDEVDAEGLATHWLRGGGLLHALLQLTTLDDVQGHPKRGASWEGSALSAVQA